MKPTEEQSRKIKEALDYFRSVSNEWVEGSVDSNSGYYRHYRSGILVKELEWNRKPKGDE